MSWNRLSKPVFHHHNFQSWLPEPCIHSVFRQRMLKTVNFYCNDILMIIFLQNILYVHKHWRNELQQQVKSKSKRFGALPWLGPTSHVTVWINDRRLLRCISPFRLIYASSRYGLHAWINFIIDWNEHELVAFWANYTFLYSLTSLIQWI